MKKILSLLTIATILITSCTKNTSTPNNSSNNNSNSTVITGNFTITKFTDSNPNDDNAADFSGYTFIFNADGTIAAVNSGVTTQGSYTEKPSHEGEAAKLTISFTNAPLSDLNKSWQVDTISDSQIFLSDDGNASEVLQFTAK